MIFNKKTILAEELASSMNDLLKKTASSDIVEAKSDKLISDLSRSSEIFDDIGNHKTAEIITKILEKIAGI